MFFCPYFPMKQTISLKPKQTRIVFTFEKGLTLKFPLSYDQNKVKQVVKVNFFIIFSDDWNKKKDNIWSNFSETEFLLLLSGIWACLG